MQDIIYRKTENSLWFWIIILNLVAAIRTLSIATSSTYAVPNTDFVITCHLRDIVVLWTRNETRVAYSFMQSTCNSSDGGYKLSSMYRYNCTNNNTFNLIIPGNRINQEDGSRWQCKNTGDDNSSGIFTLKVASVPLSDPSVTGYNGTILIPGNLARLICTVPGGIPLAILSWTCQGRSLTGAVIDKNSAKTAISELTVSINSSFDRKRCVCKADHLLWSKSKIVESKPFVVYHLPKSDPILNGYKPGIILYDGGPDLLLNCQQEGGNPLSFIKWSHTNIDVTDNSSSFISSSNIKLPVNRNLQTCTCLVTYPGSHFDYRRNKSLTFSVLYMTINLTLNKTTYERTDDIQIQCFSSIQHQNITYSWKHTVGSTLIRTLLGKTSDSRNILNMPFAGYQDMGTYTCYGDNINKEQIKSQDIQIKINDLPVFTDNISTIKSNGMTEISVDYFSVPKPIKVEWLKDGNVLYMSEKYLQNSFVTEISLTLHKVKARLQGYKSTITIMKSDQNAYGHYVLRVKNEKGTVQQKIPYFAKVDDALPNSTVIAVVIVITLLILLIVGGIVIIVWLRHKRKGNTTSQKSEQCNDGTQYENIGVESITDKNIKDTQLPEFDDQSKEVSNAYEELHHQDNMENIYNVMDTVQ